MPLNARAESVSSEVRFANNYVFRGVRQLFDEQNNPVERTSIRSKVNFTSDSGYLLGIEANTLSNDLELRIKAGFSATIGDSKVQVITQQYQFEEREDFQEIFFSASQANVEIDTVYGIGSAGNAYSLSYKGLLSSDTSYALKFGLYEPDNFQVQGALTGSSEYYQVTIAQSFSGIVLGLDFVHRFLNSEDNLIISLQTNWTNNFSK